jgi:hypothetical protein
MQTNRLIHGQQLVKSILTSRSNAQPKIDFRERSHRDRHGWMMDDG